MLRRFVATALSFAFATLVLSPVSIPNPVAAQDGCSGSVCVLTWHDLPKDDDRSQELSGIAWDEGTHTLFAISDDTPKIVPLKLSADFRTLTFGEVIPVSIADDWDGEGIALTNTGFFMSDEIGPHIYDLDRSGQMVDEIPLPAHFNRIRRNLSLEALTLTADQRYLFTANEQALDGDGPQASADAGTTIRILRYDRSTQAEVEYAYRTDPVFAPGQGGDRGVTELVALSPTDLLVLERSFVSSVGNNVRIYRTNLSEAVDVIDIDVLSDETPVVPKVLLIDLETLPDGEFPPTLQPQPNRILDNFEGMTLGPLLPDGRQVLFLVSDDNKRATQIPRLLVLTVRGL